MGSQIGPKINKDGLVMHLDAGSQVSYPIFGSQIAASASGKKAHSSIDTSDEGAVNSEYTDANQWIDISGNENHLELVPSVSGLPGNGGHPSTIPDFSKAANGCIYFCGDVVPEPIWGTFSLWTPGIGGYARAASFGINPTEGKFSYILWVSFKEHQKAMILLNHLDRPNPLQIYIGGYLGEEEDVFSGDLGDGAAEGDGRISAVGIGKSIVVTFLGARLVFANASYIFGDWIHIAVSAKSAPPHIILQLYINGSLIHSYQYVPSDPGGIWTPEFTALIGSTGVKGSTYGFKGYISSIKVYNKYMGPIEISNEYKSSVKRYEQGTTHSTHRYFLIADVSVSTGYRWSEVEGDGIKRDLGGYILYEKRLPYSKFLSLNNENYYAIRGLSFGNTHKLSGKSSALKDVNVNIYKDDFSFSYPRNTRDSEGNPIRFRYSNTYAGVDYNGRDASFYEGIAKKFLLGSQSVSF